jgi:hypothetical protein
VAISLIALMGMVVLVVDVGGLVTRRRELVNANDAAALAAAQSFAVNEAVCGVSEGPAQDAADDLAAQNVDSPGPFTLFDADCVAQTVTVEYDRQQDLFFAPVLGFGDETNVTATATAIWGQAGEGNPVPIELDPLLTADCVFEDEANGIFKPPGPCPTGYWFNNQDLTNSSWGLMNLETWSATPNGSCPAGGASLLADWISQNPDELLTLEFTSRPMYVCTDGGSQTPTWFNALEAQEGNVLLFPINDPEQMIFGPPTSQEQYAIMAFAPMKVENVLHGNDEEAIGTPGTPAQSGDCGNGVPIGLSVAGTVNLGVRADADCGAPSSVDAIPFSSVQVWSGSGANRVNYDKCSVASSNCDYLYNETTFELTWVNGATRAINKSVNFTWTVNATAGTPGACGIQASDPNAKCLVLSWAGPQLIGTTPQPGTGFGAEAITLVK